MRGRIPDHHLDRSFQFFSVIPIASSPKGTQEVMGMSLQKRRAGSHDFSTLCVPSTLEPPPDRNDDGVREAMGGGGAHVGEQPAWSHRHPPPHTVG